MQADVPLSRWLLLLYCLATGFSVAAVVYHQSMTQLIADAFRLPSDSLWGLSMATQFGYGAGLILGLPLGDMMSPRRLIAGTLLGLGTVLVLIAGARSVALLTALCALAGLLSVGGQLLIAHCAKSCAPAERPAVIGSLLSALFAGLLLARVLAGWGGEHIGWRGVYLLVGAVTLLLGLALYRHVRELPPSLRMGYATILAQQGRLWRAQPDLRRLALVAACFFAASNGVWANLGSLTHTALHWSAAETGLLAFTSLAALRAPMLSNWLQQRMSWQRAVILLGGAVAVVSLVGSFVGAHVVMIVTFLVITDFSIRSVQSIAQARVLAIDPPSASRLNSLFMTVFFFGAALGSWLGGIAIHHLGWMGMYLFPLLCALAGLGCFGLDGPLGPPGPGLKSRARQTTHPQQL